MCSAPPVCCMGCLPPQCCRPGCQVLLDQLRAAKRHCCCSSDSQCELCSQIPKKELCSNYMRNKYIVYSLSCLFRISQFQVLATLFRLACDEVKPMCRYPRDRVWSVMENVKSPYTELLDLTIYDSLHDRCGQPIDPLNRTNAYKVMRLIFMFAVLVPDQQNRLMTMLHQLNRRSICPVNLEGLLLVLGKLSLFQLVFDILQQDERLRRFRGAREFWELSHMYQEESTEENSAVVPKRRRKKIPKNTVKNTNEQKKPPTRKPRPIFCTRRNDDTEESAEASGRPDELTRADANPASRRSSVLSRHSSVHRTQQTTTPVRWISGSATRSNHLHPHSTPILGLRSLYL